MLRERKLIVAAADDNVRVQQGDRRIFALRTGSQANRGDGVSRSITIAYKHDALNSFINSNHH